MFLGVFRTFGIFGRSPPQDLKKKKRARRPALMLAPERDQLAALLAARRFMFVIETRCISISDMMPLR